MTYTKPVFIAFTAIIVMFYLFRGIPTGNETLYVELIGAGSDYVSAPKAGSVFYYYAEVKLESGEIIRLLSKSHDLLDFQGGYIKVETYFSLLRFKTVYILKDYSPTLQHYYSS